jgi:hypothetical protein
MNVSIYYIDRCELWGFICEINSGISFFLPELLLHNYTCGGYVPCCVTGNTHAIVNWKNSALKYYMVGPIIFLLSGWYHDQGLIKGMIWAMPCNNLHINPVWELSNM